MLLEIGKYVNPLLDHGFKKLFGHESTKRFLIAFLNELLPAKKQIIDLSYSNPENQGETHDKRIVDLFKRIKFIIHIHTNLVGFV